MTRRALYGRPLRESEEEKKADGDEAIQRICLGAEFEWSKSEPEYKARPHSTLNPKL